MDLTLGILIGGIGFLTGVVVTAILVDTGTIHAGALYRRPRLVPRRQLFQPAIHGIRRV